MELDFILKLIEEGGYIGLFLWLLVGVFIVPVPNELIVMTIGLAASLQVLNPVIAFFVTYSGIITTLTVSYLLGKYVGRPLLSTIEKRERFSKKLEKSKNTMDKYHSYSLLLSCFLPGMRILVPFLYGTAKIPFKTFALFAYSGALIWLMIFFSLGYWFGDHKEKIVQHEKEVFFFIVIALFIYIVQKVIRKKKKERVRAL
ncbi:DedA family protein [Bacillus sp. 31A1R]|uniref:DedA family protein n=1 Tax=Robertmurraya mangrovi TaxID=3098077 RepID=A0ABU5IYB4_9BACI|nr:DedA family protein [Bacillus sp. 31A1R]MDZ5472090.1 DedA family protein [Bacillus sp. 31A1R]